MAVCQRQTDISRASLFAHEHYARLGDTAGVDPFFLAQLEFAGIDLRQVEDVVDQRVKVLAALMDQEAKVRAELAATNDTITKLQGSLAAATSAGGDPKNIAYINEMIATQTKIKLDLEAKDKELQEKITDRLNLYGVRVQDMESFGYQIQSVNQAWASLNKSKDSITDTMDSLILQENH